MRIVTWIVAALVLAASLTALGQQRQSVRVVVRIAEGHPYADGQTAAELLALHARLSRLLRDELQPRLPFADLGDSGTLSIELVLRDRAKSATLREPAFEICSRPAKTATRWIVRDASAYELDVDAPDQLYLALAGAILGRLADGGLAQIIDACIADVPLLRTAKREDPTHWLLPFSRRDFGFDTRFRLVTKEEIDIGDYFARVSQFDARLGELRARSIEDHKDQMRRDRSKSAIIYLHELRLEWPELAVQPLDVRLQ